MDLMYENYYLPTFTGDESQNELAEKLNASGSAIEIKKIFKHNTFRVGIVHNYHTKPLYSRYYRFYKTINISIYQKMNL